MNSRPPRRIRRAEQTDLTTLVELHRQFCVIDDHRFDSERAGAAFAPLLADDRHGLVWIVDDNRGYAVLTWGWSIEAGGREAVLDEIFVIERDRGVGAALVAHVIAESERLGHSRIFLETERRNSRVRAFYERHGFVVEDSIWMSRAFIDVT